MNQKHPKELENWIDEIASDDVLRQAYDWLCERRVDYSPNDDVWDVRWRWEQIRPALQDALRAGDYRMSSVRRFSSGGGHPAHRAAWSWRRGPG
jgi:hypothetical protein